MSALSCPRVDHCWELVVAEASPRTSSLVYDVITIALLHAKSNSLKVPQVFYT